MMPIYHQALCACGIIPHGAEEGLQHIAAALPCVNRKKPGEWKQKMHNRDLTEGPVFKTISLFALPMLFGNILQQAYNIVDTWVVGRYISSDALAGVGSSFTLMTFLTSVLLGLCMGSGVVFSICFGARDEDGFREGIGASFLLIAAVTAVLTAVPLLCVDSIIDWLNTPEAVRELTSDYLGIVFWGIPAVFLYNFFGAYLKAIGNSVIPLVFLGISTVMNIVLDLLFVITFDRGAAGAAEATVIAQYAAGLGIGVYVLLKSSLVRISLLHIRPSLPGIRKIASFSVFTCLQQSVMNLGILMVQGLVNSFGTTIMAAFAAAVKIDSFAYMPAQEYANAFSTFIAQNSGAGKSDRVVKGLKSGVATSLTYCALASLVLWFLSGRLMEIFVDPAETEIIAHGVRYLRIEGAFYCGIGCLFLLYGLYRALGKPAMSLVLTVISLGTRVVLAYTLAPVESIGVSGIWWAVPIGWLLADTFGLVFLAFNRKKLLGLPARSGK